MLPFQTEETLLRVDGLSKKYDQPVLNNVSLEIKNITRPDCTQGQIVSLVGKSGCGKSTLFRIMAGLEKADSGTVMVHKPIPATGVATDVEPTHGLEPVREGQMGVVFQNSYVYPWRKVKTILKMARSRSTAKPKVDDLGVGFIDEVEHYAELLNLKDHMNKYSSQLSGGQRQRVAIAEQLLNGGDFILMDEPFSGLDTLTIDKVTQTLTKVALEDERKTFVIVSHDLSNCLAISDTAYVLATPEPGKGSTITHRIDLATQGLAWQPEIKENPLFRDLLKQVKSLL